VTSYGDYVKMCEDFAPNFDGKRTDCCITLLFHQGIFHQNQHDCRPPPNLLFSVSRLKIKLKDSHFDTTEVMEAESHAVLNILSEHGFQDAF
jgi:hypothetical protein